MALFTQDEKRDLAKSAIVGGASSIGSGLINLGLNTAAGAIENKMERKNMRLQAELEKGIMDHQMELYRPEAQVRRLQQAGLNAGLMYNNGSMQSGGATGSIGLASPDISSPQTNPLLLSQVDLQQAQADKTRQESKTEEKNTILKHIEILQAEYNLKEISPARKQQILQEIEESNARIRNIDSETALNQQQKEFNDKANPKRLKQIDAAARNDNAQAWRTEVHALYEQIHGQPMSNGMNAVIDRFMNMIVGTPKYQELVQGITGDATTEMNGVERIETLLRSITSNDKQTWEVINPTASFLFRLFKAISTKG